MQGAFPATVSERLRDLRVGRDASPVAKPDPGDRNYYPELHPLDFEWYFTVHTAEALARLMPAKDGETLCLGTPTVAAALARRSLRYRLVDANVAVRTRFPELRRGSAVHFAGIARAPQYASAADVLIFDPPWLFHDTLHWLSIAAGVTKVGGVIAFSLFPALTRPHALEERERILAAASRIGEVDVVDGPLVYETPLFEREALRACGVGEPGNWRRGDLVTVRLRNPKAAAQVRLPPRRRWHSFRIAGQIVKLRRGNRDSTGPPLLPVEGLEGFVYPTVSSRDHRFDLIDVWTSRNRVARVGNFCFVARVLRSLQGGAGLSDTLNRVCAGPEFPKMVDSLEVSFRELIAL